jgi:hypothetical protein
MTLHRDEAGLVGKIVVIWLLLLALLGVAAVDAVSIAFTTFRLSGAATNAARTAATSYRGAKDMDVACGAARTVVQTEAEDATLPKGFCKVDTQKGEVTITIRQKVSTIVAGRLSFTERFTNVMMKETAGPTAL